MEDMRVNFYKWLVSRIVNQELLGFGNETSNRFAIFSQGKKCLWDSTDTEGSFSGWRLRAKFLRIEDRRENIGSNRVESEMDVNKKNYLAGDL